MRQWHARRRQWQRHFFGGAIHCALVKLRGEMLIQGDVAGRMLAAPFDGNVTSGDISGGDVVGRYCVWR